MIILICTLFILLSCTILLPIKAIDNINTPNIYIHPKYMYILFGILLMCISGFRGEGIDRDYSNYKDLYYLYNDSWSFTIEPSFVLISHIIKKYLNDSIVYLFIIYAVIGIVIKLYAIKQLSQFWALSILVYLSYSFPLHDMTQIRFGVAVGFTLLTIKPLYERKLVKFIIFALLAVLFHYSAIIVFFLWFLNPTKINVRIYAFVIILIYLFNHTTSIFFSGIYNYIPIAPIQNKILNHSLEDGVFINVYNAWQLMRTFLSLLFLYKINIIYSNNKYAILLLKLYILSTCAFVLLSTNPDYAGRISDLLAISEIIMLPCLLYFIKQKFLAKLMVICISFSFLFLNLFYNRIIM